MSAIDREDALEAILSKLAEREEPCPPWIYATIRECLDDMPSLPSEKPLVYDGFYLCDKKPGACPSWERKGWTKCMSKHCNRTSRVDHALKLPDANDGWIPVEDRSPEIDMSYPHSDSYLVWYGGWDIPAIVSYSNVNRFWTDHVTDPHWNAAPFCKVIAWRPLPPDFKPKEDR